jgi:hypothetical protein
LADYLVLLVEERLLGCFDRRLDITLLVSLGVGVSIRFVFSDMTVGQCLLDDWGRRVYVST